MVHLVDSCCIFIDAKEASFAMRLFLPLKYL